MSHSIVRRYRALRAVARRHNHAAIHMVARNALLETARSLGLAQSGTLLINDDTELELIFDLCLHTARPGRSRAIDRLARATTFPDGSDDAVVLAALRRAQFSIWRVVRRAPEFGLIVEDTLRGGEAWVVDEAMTATAPPGIFVAGRLSTPGAFGMWGRMSPVVTPEVVEEMTATIPLALADMPMPMWGNDYRFAATVYRAVIATDALQFMRLAEVPDAA